MFFPCFCSSFNQIAAVVLCFSYCLLVLSYCIKAGPVFAFGLLGHLEQVAVSSELVHLLE